jgi:hypothetical protein
VNFGPTPTLSVYLFKHCERFALLNFKRFYPARGLPKCLSRLADSTCDGHGIGQSGKAGDANCASFQASPACSLFQRTTNSSNCFVVEWGLVMETDTARAVVKAIYPTIIMIMVMMLAASLL